MGILMEDSTCGNEHTAVGMASPEEQIQREHDVAVPYDLRSSADGRRC